VVIGDKLDMTVFSRTSLAAFSCLVAGALALAPLDLTPVALLPPEEKNPCEGAQPVDANFYDENYNVIPGRTVPNYFKNQNCSRMDETGFGGLNLGVVLAQSGRDISPGAVGDVEFEGLGDTTGPITENYKDTDLCPVNVHWHLGAEHKVIGQYDEDGSGPCPHKATDCKKAADARQGLQCHHYNPDEAMYTTAYDWEHCVDMEVGQTYEVHWPHSAAGMCGTKWQYQLPFYDGVFCRAKDDFGVPIISLGDHPAFNVNKKVGVQGQVFTIVNTDIDKDGEPDEGTEDYTYDTLFEGAWGANEADGIHWNDVAKYIGSTTGTSRQGGGNEGDQCSLYAPITWQVDRTCHKISAASFDLMCKTMKEQADDMSDDLYPHGSREVVTPEFSAQRIHKKSSN